ncbi:MAG: phosphatidylinositol-binding protein scs2 [Caeruleum heppii]|nr:MAG: phosphatidylinositol-binding protein scs2 [Caeruleum heppii]
MSVDLSPMELGFQRPFTHEVTQTLRLRNPNRDPVAFKVKTTAPKHYCVRPNSGRIEAGREVEVSVLLQPMKEDPPPIAKCHDKFLVQTVAITADREFSNIAAIWQHVEQTSKSSINEKKIRVTFLPADGSSVTSNPNGTYADHDLPTSEPPAYRSPSPEAVTPNRGLPVGAVSRPESRPADNKHLGDAVSSAANPSTSDRQSSSAPSAGGVSAHIPQSIDDLKAQLSEAKATIVRLTNQAGSSELRQRKTEKVTQDARERITTGTTGMGVQQQPAEGVPVQIVAALCLLSFLIAYLLF